MTATTNDTTQTTHDTASHEWRSTHRNALHVLPWKTKKVTSSDTVKTKVQNVMNILALNDTKKVIHQATILSYKNKGKTVVLRSETGCER